MKNDDSWIPLASGDFEDGLVKSTNPAAGKKKKIRLVDLIIALLAVALCVVLMLYAFRCAFTDKPQASYDSERGYYNYNDTTLYYQDGIWYEYDYGLGWVLADPDESFLEEHNSYYDGSLYESQNGASDFSMSEYYKPYDYNYNANQGNDANRQNSNDFDFDGDNDWE